MKLTSDSGCLRLSARSAQLMYGLSWLSPVIAKNSRARLIQGGDARVATTRQVQGRQIERQTEQVVAQRFGDELVDLVADLAGHTANDRPCRLVRGQRRCRRTPEG